LERLIQLVAQLQYSLSANAPVVGASSSAGLVGAGSDGEIVSSVIDALECGDWASMRHLVSNTALEIITASDGLSALMTHDRVLRRRLADASHEAADWFEQLRTGMRLPELGWMLVMGNPEAGSRRTAACLLRDHMLLPPDLVGTTAALLADSTYQAKVIVDLVGRLDELDGMSVGNLQTLMQHQRHTETIGAALLKARPTTRNAAHLLLELLFLYVDGQRWHADPHEVLDLMRWFQSTAERDEDWSAIPHSRRLIALLDGAAVQYVERDMSRPAALLSLCRLLLEPELDAIARGVFESTRVSDWPLLFAVLDASAWTERPVESEQADFFHGSIYSAIGQLMHRADKRPLQQLLALGDSCYRSIEGSPGQHSADYARIRGEIADGTFTGSSDSVYEAVSGQFMTAALLGSDSPDTLRTPLVDDAEPRFDGARWQLDSQDVLRYAHVASFERGRGPTAILMVVDCAIESGDLAYARGVMEDVLRFYPENSMVYEWQHKIAGHTSNEPKALEAIDNIRRLWRDDVDTATPIAQVEVMERMWDVKSLRFDIRGRAAAVLDLPGFEGVQDRLERLTRG
jgi:hypothetical protein